MAINALNKSAKEGGWLMLQNIHLMQAWLKVLERTLEIIEVREVSRIRHVIDEVEEVSDDLRKQALVSVVTL